VFQVEVVDSKRKRDEEEIQTVNDAEPVQEPVKKKKKVFLGKTNFVNDDEFEDMFESGWFYIDSSGNPQGPFTSKEMKEWFIAGFFYETTMVKRINDLDYLPISECPEFQHCELSSTVVSTSFYTNTLPQEVAPPKTENLQPAYEDFYSPYDDPTAFDPNGTFAQTAFFNSHTGRFTPTSSYHASKGPDDRDGRMLSHYLNIEEYQEKMREAKNNLDNLKRPKITKQMIKTFKKKKEDKQRRRILMM